MWSSLHTFWDRYPGTEDISRELWDDLRKGMERGGEDGKGEIEIEFPLANIIYSPVGRKSEHPSNGTVAIVRLPTYNHQVVPSRVPHESLCNRLYISVTKLAIPKELTHELH